MTSRAEVAMMRAATIEANRHGSTCTTCISGENPDQPCDCVCATCVNAQRSASSAVRAALQERAESFAADACKFNDMASAWDVSRREQVKARRFAVVYRLVADELRKVASS